MKNILVTTLLSSLLLGLVHAQEDRPEAEKKAQKGERRNLFQRMDTDSDGEVTKQEFFAVKRMAKIPEEQRDDLYARLDENGDGVLTGREVREMRKNRREKANQELKRLDGDGSGGVDFTEFQRGEMWSKLPEKRQRAIFERMDRNDDGEISPADRPRKKGGKKGKKGKKGPRGEKVPS